MTNATCSFGSSELVGFRLDALDELFHVTTSSATVSSLYAVGGAVYFTTLAGEVVRIGSATAGGDGSGGTGGTDDDEDGTRAAAPLTVGGWRQVQ